MRILLLLSARFPTVKAYGIQIMAMAKGFMDADHVIAVAYPRRSNEIPPTVPGVEFFPYGPRVVSRHESWYIPLRLLSLFGLRGVFSHFKPDAIIANDPIQVAFVSKDWRVIWDLHDLPNPDRWDRRFLMRKISRRAAGIISTNSLKLRRLEGIVGALPPKIILPNPITFSTETCRAISRASACERVGIVNDGRSVVYAGQLYDWKGVDTLVVSARFLSNDVTIHVVGGFGEDLERCKKRAVELSGSHARVVFHGMRPIEEIPYWLRAATVVSIPNSGKFRVSLEDTNPMKLYEALSAGAAIIASDLPSIREAFGPDVPAELCRPDDPQDLARVILDVIDSPSRATTLRVKAEAFSLLTAQERAKRIVEWLSRYDSLL